MSAQQFIQTFIQRQGLWMLGANVLAKLAGFAAVVLVTRTVSEASYGAYAYAMVLVSAFVPFMGFGAYQAFLKFGADAPGQSAKRQLHAYALARGTMLSLALVAAITACAFLLGSGVPESVPLMQIVVWTFVSTLWMEHTKSYAKCLHLNRASAQIDITYSFLLVAMAWGFTSVWGVEGYAYAVVSAPALASLPWMARLHVLHWSWKPLADAFQGFWSYGMYTAFGALLANAFYAVDVYLIGRCLADSADDVALYRVAFLIPLATRVVPVAVAATDFVKTASYASNAHKLWAYMKNYWRTFGLLSLAMLTILWGLTPWLLTVFGPGYEEGAGVMRVLLLGMLGGHWLRIPLGNMLSALGRANWNTMVNAVVLSTTAILCLWRIPTDGISGAAKIMAGMIWLNGAMSLCLLWLHTDLLRRQSQV